MKGSGPAVAVAGRASPLVAARTLWRFSRPHTLIVTTTSIFGIYVIAAETLPGAAVGNGLGDLALTLVAGALVNLYIVGINQCEDVEIDRVNKPGLPIPAGLLSVRAAWWLVTVSGLLALAMALTQGWVETVAVGAALAIGTAYSSPPFRLKRFPALAAASISLVRAAVVNVGVYLHFASTLGGRPGLSELPGPVVALTLFVLPFSFAIAVLKDIPDAEGDRRYRIATFTVRLGARAAFLMGVTALAGAYVAMIVAAPLLLDDASAAVVVAGHLACLAVLLWLALRVDLTDRVAFTRFYLRVWALFFAEYLLMPLAVAVA